MVDGDEEFLRVSGGPRGESWSEPYGWLTLRGYHWLPGTPEQLPGLPGLWSADLDQRPRGSRPRPPTV